jgi:parallel beta-helix repeat protein
VVFRGADPNDPPVFSGGSIETRWVQSDLPGVWQITTTAPPNLLLEDGHPLAPVSLDALRPGTWFWGENQLYYMPTGGIPSAHEVWRPSRGGGITIVGKSWVVIENIRCFVGQGACVSIRGGQHNVVRNLTAHYFYRGINVGDGSNDNLIEDCSVYGNHDGIYIFGASSRNIVRRCKAMNNGNLPAWSDADRVGIAIGDSGPNVGNIVEDCEITGNGGPFSDSGLIAYDAPNTIFRRNRIYDNYGSGVFVTIRSNGSLVQDNSVYDNGAEAVKNGFPNIAGLSIRRSNGVTVQRNQVMNNHVSADSLWAGQEMGPRGGLDLRGLSTDDMSNIKLVDNCVQGTVGGPNFFMTAEPDFPGLQITWANCEGRPEPPTALQID